MRKSFFLLSLICLLSIPEMTYASGAVKLADFIVSSSGLSELLTKNGVKGIDAKQVESYVFTSLNSFGGGKNLTRQEFSDILSKLPVSGEDASMRKELQILLDKPESEIKKEDIVKAINNIIYLANRHGKSVVITCAECVSESLTKNGFKFTVENIQSATSVKLLNDIIPNNPKDLQVFISSRVKRLGFGDYSKVTPDVVSPAEEKTLALFLALADSGSSEYKTMIAAIKKVSTKNGKTNLFDPTDPNKLWKVVSSDLSTAELKQMEKVLFEVDRLTNKENLKVEEAFNRVLRKKAEKSEELLAKYKSLKAKRCFFK
jgi:predicted Zn-ribbon and HTH transcriptional regulator